MPSSRRRRQPLRRGNSALVMKLTVLADNLAEAPWVGEHGLALLLDHPAGQLLFDTGAGAALAPNGKLARLNPAELRQIVLSHGHFDHTGGVADLLPLAPQAEVYFGSGVEKVRYSHHPGRPVKELTFPKSGLSALCTHPSDKLHSVATFTEIAPGLLLTGAIPRVTFEDCGGPFFLDEAATQPDTLEDEIALLTTSGALIQGCCHAGILNTLTHCMHCHPEIPVRTIVGGLHLLHASPERLEKTANALNQLSLERLILLHCTGEAAVDFLKTRLTCEVCVGQVGDSYLL